jgi:GAF domain-containing protein
MAPPHDHDQRLLALVDAEPESENDPPGAPGLLRRLCSALTRALPATWAGISLAEDGQVGSTLTGSDRQALGLEDLQFDLAEGPCVESVATRRPVLEADVAGSGTSRWPAYGPAAQQHGVRSVFAFPLIMGAVCVGALDIYQDRASALSPAAVVEATAFAALAVGLLESGQSRAPAGELDPHVDELLAPRQPVYQAQGMIMADLRITAEEAVALLRAHAFSLGHPVMDVAQDVVAGRLRLTL